MRINPRTRVAVTLQNYSEKYKLPVHQPAQHPGLHPRRRDGRDAV